MNLSFPSHFYTGCNVNQHYMNKDNISTVLYQCYFRQYTHNNLSNPLSVSEPIFRSIPLVDLCFKKKPMAVVYYKNARGICRKQQQELLITFSVFLFNCSAIAVGSHGTYRGMQHHCYHIPDVPFNGWNSSANTVCYLFLLGNFLSLSTRI